MVHTDVATTHRRTKLSALRNTQIAGVDIDTDIRHLKGRVFDRKTMINIKLCQ